MNSQEIFDTTYDAIMAQGKPSIGKDGICKYRGEGGTKCALGFLIDDETAQKWDVFGGILDVTYKTPVPDWVTENLSLLRDIQDVHDNAANTPDFVADFKQHMQEVAEDHFLEFKE